MPSLRPLILLVAVLTMLLAACAPPNTGQAPGSGAPTVSESPGASASASPPPSPNQTPLAPAQPTDLFNIFPWIFTPIFQAMFIVLVGIYVALTNLGIPGAIGFAIVGLTIIVRAILIPLFRKQLVSQRRMQMLQPEIAELRRRYKGDRTKVAMAQQELFRERSINPASGCLPILLQFPLLIIIYSVISQGLTNYNVEPMLTVAGVQVVPLDCPETPVFRPGTTIIDPCIDTVIPWLAGLDVSQPEVFIGTPGVFLGGLGFLAIISGLFQLVQSRMMLTPADPKNDDPTTRTTRQMMYILPLISLLYAAIFPAGLFIYWIVTTIFSIVQQYLIVGWGAMFPFLGWNPAFAQAHTPRFPVTMPPANPALRKSAAGPSSEEIARGTSVKQTIRPNKQRGRQGRRGRRR